MSKPSTPAVWASGKAFGFQPSAAQQAQGFDYIATVRPSTGAPITDDHDWPLNNITTALKWTMDQLPDSGFVSASGSDWFWFTNPSGFITQCMKVTMPAGTTAKSFTFPKALSSKPVAYSVVNDSDQPTAGLALPSIGAVSATNSTAALYLPVNPSQVGLTYYVTIYGK